MRCLKSPTLSFRKGYKVMNRLFAFILILLPGICLGASEQRALFILEENKPDKTFSATMVLPNNTNYTFSNWQIAFNFIPTITQVDEGVVSKHVGSFYIISPKTTQNIVSHGKFIFHIQGKGWIKHITDAPSGYFYIMTKPNYPQVTISLKAGADLSKVVREQDKKEQPTAPCPSLLNAEQSLIVPLPVALSPSTGVFVLNPETKIIVSESAKSAIKAADFFTKSISKATGFSLKPQITKTMPIPVNAIIFTNADTGQNLGNEGYTMEVKPSAIVISANTEAGFFYAVQSLRQLLPASVFSQTLQKNEMWSIPSLSIRDYPRFSYRGLLLDVSRHFFSPAQIKRVIDLMSLYKLNRLHLHLTDDEGWRIEVKGYPALTSIGAWRGFNLPLEPQYGSGANRYGGYYTQKEIREMVQYAQQRNVTIIPEIDLPGHARALMKSFSRQLVDVNDASVYTSVQQYDDNVLSPCQEETYTIIDQILTEVAALFPSKVFHVGADEVPSGSWAGSPQCKYWMQKYGLKTMDELKGYFLKRVEAILKSKQKEMAVWDDGVTVDDALDHSTVIYSWADEKKGIRAAEQGYSVVLMPGPYLYLDMAYNSDPAEPGRNWAGLIDTKRVYSYQPINPSLSTSAEEHIQGVQGALWSEHIDSQHLLDYMMFPRLLALAEIAWTRGERQCWDHFSLRFDRVVKKRLEYQGVNYRSKGL